jgi:ankyrin repeat protein
MHSTHGKEPYQTLRKSLTGLHVAAAGNLKTTVEALLENETNPSPKSEDGETTLYQAAELGHDEIVCLLIKRGADVNARGGHYGGALQAACE